MNFFLRLARFLVNAVVVTQTVRLAAKSVRKHRAAPATGRVQAPKDLGEMVRDPVCGVYLPADQAISTSRIDGTLVGYCSEACRSKHSQR